MNSRGVPPVVFPYQNLGLSFFFFKFQIRQISLKNNRQKSRSNKIGGAAAASSSTVPGSNPDSVSFSSAHESRAEEGSKSPENSSDLADYNMEAFPAPKRELPRTPPMLSQENRQAIEEAIAPPTVKNVIPTG